MLYDKLTGRKIEFDPCCDYKGCYYFAVPWIHAHHPKNQPLMNLIINNLIFLVLVLPIVWFTRSHVIGFLYLAAHYYLFFGRFMCLATEL